MKTPIAALIAVAGAVALTGCVQRRIDITSEPSGARVWLNDQDIGETPVEVDFEWYGVYDVRLHKDGYEPLVTKAEAKAPIYEQPGIDLIALAIPVTKRTRIAWHFDLVPSAELDPGLLDRAKDLREQERATGELDTGEPTPDATAAPATESP